MAKTLCQTFSLMTENGIKKNFIKKGEHINDNLCIITRLVICVTSSPVYPTPVLVSPLDSSFRVHREDTTYTKTRKLPHKKTF